MNGLKVTEMAGLSMSMLTVLMKCGVPQRSILGQLLFLL